jgi:hypothetical protein
VDETVEVTDSTKTTTQSLAFVLEGL